MTDEQPEAPPERLDGRITVTDSELSKVVALLAETINESWISTSVRSNYGDTKKTLNHAAADNLARSILQRINQARLGYAEGTVAVHRDGRLARRYYSAAGNRLTWLVIQPPSDEPLEVDSGCELPGYGWTICSTEPWQVVQ